MQIERKNADLEFPAERVQEVGEFHLAAAIRGGQGTQEETRERERERKEKKRRRDEMKSRESSTRGVVVRMHHRQGRVGEITAKKRPVFASAGCTSPLSFRDSITPKKVRYDSYLLYPVLLQPFARCTRSFTIQCPTVTPRKPRSIHGIANRTRINTQGSMGVHDAKMVLRLEKL